MTTIISNVSKEELPKAVIFGASLSGMSAKKYLDNTYNIIAFCDNDKQKHNTLLQNLPILSIEQLDTTVFDKLLIASEFFEQIEQQVLELNTIAKDKIEILPATVIKPVHFDQDESITANAIAILHLVCQHLNTFNITYYVDAGTLLGIYRDNALIPWDDDLDLAISSSHLKLTIESIEDLFPQLEELTGKSWLLTQHIAAQDFGAVKKGDIRALKLHPKDNDSTLPMMDFFVKYIEGEWMDYTLSSRGFRMPSEHILQLDTVTFAGQTINVPSKIELYLERHYGEWRTPKKNWNLSDLKNTTVFGIDDK